MSQFHARSSLDSKRVFIVIAALVYSVICALNDGSTVRVRAVWARLLSGQPLLWPVGDTVLIAPVRQLVTTSA